MSDLEDLARERFLTTARNYALLAEQAPFIVAAALACCDRLRKGGKIIFCGNGGSAADCQHLAAELVGRFILERRPLPALALTTDSSILTSISNDYGFAEIFERQVKALGRAEDVLIGLTTSGRSENVIRALNCARAMGLLTIGLFGSKPTDSALVCDHAIHVPAEEAARVQEMHIGVGHLFCEIIERELR